MNIPEAFDKIASTFHQDTYLIFNTLDEAILASVSELAPEEERIAKAYLDELLSGRYSDEQLLDIWLKTSAGSGGFGFRKEDAAKMSTFSDFLRRIRAALEAGIKPNRL